MVQMLPLSEAGGESGKDWKPGIYFNLPYNTYDSIRALRRSDYKHIRTGSPMKAKARTAFNPGYVATENKDSDTTDPLTFGSAYHTFILEREKFYDEHRIWPGDPIDHDKIKVHRDDHLTYIAMDKSIKKLNGSDILFSGGAAEVTMIVPHHTGLLIKIRADYFGAWGGWDLKSVRDLSKDSLRSSFKRYYYNIQAAMVADAMQTLRRMILEDQAIVYGAETEYLDTLIQTFLLYNKPYENMMFLCQEKEAPCPVVPIRIKKHNMEKARVIWEEAVVIFAGWGEKYGWDNEWPPCDDTWVELDLDGWGDTDY